MLGTLAVVSPVVTWKDACDTGNVMPLNGAKRRVVDRLKSSFSDLEVGWVLKQKGPATGL